MKTHYPFLFAAALFNFSSAQTATPPVVAVETVTPAQTTVTETTVVPGVRRLDPALARRQLGIVPRALPAATPGATPAPGTKIETTETTVTENVPGFPPRVYNTERSVVVVEGRELPYLTIPVLFVKETAELLDSDSRTAIEDTSMAIQEVLKFDPNAVFDIEGHTSTDGTDEMNIELSAQRARRVFEELTKRYAIPTTALSAHGYGEHYPKFPNGTEEQMVLDRRVLVVRVK